MRAGDREAWVEGVFVATGRAPNLAGLGLDRLGCRLDPRGVPEFDARTLRVGRLPVYLTGDATGGPANLQVAAEQGRIAGYNACHRFPRRVGCKTPMAIIFTDLNIAMVGQRWSENEREGKHGRLHSRARPGPPARRGVPPAGQEFAPIFFIFAFLCGFPGLACAREQSPTGCPS